jgi:hypothetical protein
MQIIFLLSHMRPINLDINLLILRVKEAVSKVNFYPQAPQGGMCNILIFRQVPLRLRVAASAEQSQGDLGVIIKERTFETASSEGDTLPR